VSWPDHISGTITENIGITRISIVSLGHEWRLARMSMALNARSDDCDSKTRRAEQHCDAPAVVTLWDDSA
jgi:hypothetical protein